MHPIVKSNHEIKVNDVVVVKTSVLVPMTKVYRVYQIQKKQILAILIGAELDSGLKIEFENLVKLLVIDVNDEKIDTQNEFRNFTILHFNP
jgi:hypothetical protein